MANIKIDNLADEIMNGLKEYADLATDDLKKSVRKAGNTAVKKSDVGNNSSKNNAVSKVPAATATPVPTETPDQDSSEKENSDFKLKEYEDGRVVLVKYKGHDENVTIPDSVKPIEETAFYCCEKLESVIL